MDRRTYKALFQDTNDGQVLNINVFNTTPGDWQEVLEFVPRHFACTYMEDAVEAVLPEYSAIVQRRYRATLLLSIEIHGTTINTHFRTDDAIQFDILPKEVDSPESGDEVVGFMRTLSSLLKKDIFLNEEHGSASDEWLRERALGYIEASTSEFRLNE